MFALSPSLVGPDTVGARVFGADSAIHTDSTPAFKRGRLSISLSSTSSSGFLQQARLEILRKATSLVVIKIGRCDDDSNGRFDVKNPVEKTVIIECRSHHPLMH
ncbi:hypothetical protein Mapa_004970 [Marchantia paleacea]|nr:hypothetical protein Mapa_004970 [Marchantia paleacea]